jgi:hypothetical protein
MDRESSPAYEVLRASARRVLRLVESEIERQGGGSAAVHNDYLEICGSRRIWRKAPAELDGLGLLDVMRFPKRYEYSRSDRWLQVRAPQDAQMLASAACAQDGRRWTSQRAPSRAASLDHHV